MRYAALENLLNELAQDHKIIEFRVENGICELRHRARRGKIESLYFSVDKPEGAPQLATLKVTW